MRTVRRRGSASGGGRAGRRRVAAGWWPALVALVALGAAAGCRDEPERRLPDPAALDGLYGPDAEVTLNGNVVDVRVTQEAAQLARGGALWARVGPYIYLFSPQTRDLLREYGGLGGVRVRTFHPSGQRVAEALLEQGQLNSLTWPEAIRLAARARTERTRRISAMEDLVRYGEDLVRHEYNPRYAGRRR